MHDIARLEGRQRQRHREICRTFSEDAQVYRGGLVLDASSNARSGVHAQKTFAQRYIVITSIDVGGGRNETLETRILKRVLNL